jgi:hypothetical protein
MKGINAVSNCEQLSSEILRCLNLKSNFRSYKLVRNCLHWLVSTRIVPASLELYATIGLAYLEVNSTLASILWVWDVWGPRKALAW